MKLYECKNHSHWQNTRTWLKQSLCPSHPSMPRLLNDWMRDVWIGKICTAPLTIISYEAGGDSIALCQAYIIPDHKIRRLSAHHIWFLELTLSCFRPCHRLCHLEGTTWWGEPPRSSTPRLSMGSELSLCTKVFNPNPKTFHGVSWDWLEGFLRLREYSSKNKKNIALCSRCKATLHICSGENVPDIVTNIIGEIHWLF